MYVFLGKVKFKLVSITEIPKMEMMKINFHPTKCSSGITFLNHLIESISVVI
jgi:hypothetical protein